MQDHADVVHTERLEIFAIGINANFVHLETLPDAIRNKIFTLRLNLPITGPYIVQPDKENFAVAIPVEAVKGNALRRGFDRYDGQVASITPPPVRRRFARHPFQRRQ